MIKIKIETTTSRVRHCVNAKEQTLLHVALSMNAKVSLIKHENLFLDQNITHSHDLN